MGVTGSGTAAPARTAAERVAAAAAGSVRDIARLLTLVENGGEAAAQVGRALIARPRRAQIIGITGAPGAGKSTLTNAMLRALLNDAGSESAPRIAVLAVDPSSPFSGGALLGDRVRMAEWATDSRVFIRSLSSRGNLGGLSAGAPGAIDLMSALGFDIVIVETVGVGQSEVDVMHLADSVVVVLAPGMGDAVQAAKAGIMEIADIVVVNKADHEGARTTVREVRAVLAIGTTHGDRRVPVLPTVAETDEGVAALARAVQDHREYLQGSGELELRRARRGRAAVRALAVERFRGILATPAAEAWLERAAASVIAGETDLYSAAAALVTAAVRQSDSSSV